MKLKYLFTGMYYSGTGYVARLLTDAGVICGHEHIFACTGYREPQPGASPWGTGLAEWPAESSWLAAQQLNHPICSEALIVHVVRDPLRVLHSRGARDARADRVGLMMLEIVAWNRLIENFCHARARIRVQVEERRGILDKLEIEQRGTFDDNNFNTHRKDDKFLTWDDLPDILPKFELQKMAARYGYES